MAIPNPNPNIADGIKSDNKTYSSNKIESLISAATELPIPEAGDAGKVLAVNSGETGYELDSLATVASTGAYSDLTGTPTIPTVPVLTPLSASDFFVDASDVSSFVAYTYGNIVIIQRLAISNVTYTGGDDKHLKVKDEFIPDSSIRIVVDDAVSEHCTRGFLSNEGYIATNDVTSTSTSLFTYAFTYVIPTT